ncbi:MAG: hypothetical protein JXA60_05375 [Candidatus Coatesbacteria bacterium]|nr:hypothetical protein [Candidatus Coatesbacteria bacterium]
MKFFRYRKPSINSLLGITQFKRKVSHATGLGLLKLLTSRSRQKQYIYQKIGLYSPKITPFRQIAKGRIKTPLGCGCVLNLILRSLGIC